MRNTDTILEIHQKRGAKALPLERVYKHLFDPELYLHAYGKIYRNDGAMTPGTTKETVDGMDLQRVHNIIGLLKMERYAWTPVRRVEIPKSNGKTRPLGIPTWSDKLVQEAIRTLLEPYYEQRFSNFSHGFRPNRSCHTALNWIRKFWRGTVWFIEGDIQGAYDNIDHEIVIDIIKRDIHDGRLVQLIRNLLKAGYMEDWRYYDTPSGTPQGGIISPLLFNVYMTDLDRFIEDTLIPAYTKGDRRPIASDYQSLTYRITEARKAKDSKRVHELQLARRRIRSRDPLDPDYRRLRYLRYADDFLLGFAGPMKEAEEIRQRIAEFLEQKLKLRLSLEKTLITHAVDEKANFLGYEITVTRDDDLLSYRGHRDTNGAISLLMPQKVVRKYRAKFSSNGKIRHRPEILAESVYTIMQRYQSVLRGIYNYYCMANNASKPSRMGYIRQILTISLLKTLAYKLKCSVNRICKMYKVAVADRKMFRVIIERPDKPPLIATFGGFPIKRIPNGLGTKELTLDKSWWLPANNRSEVVQRLLAGKCELCERTDLPVVVHHIRHLADINRPGRRPKADWEKIMAARKRKTLVVCTTCHGDIHAGRYDGKPL